MGGRRWPRSDALEVARELLPRLKSVCSKIVVAGSLRRMSEEVGDVEIVFIPRTESAKDDLFSPGETDLAAVEIDKMVSEGIIERRVMAGGNTSWGAKNKLARHRASKIPVDFFMATEENWFNYLVCRTGPSTSNIRIASEAGDFGLKWNPYGPGFTRLSDGRVMPMASERQVFESVGMKFLEPKDR